MYQSALYPISIGLPSPRVTWLEQVGDYSLLEIYNGSLPHIPYTSVLRYK